MSSFTEYIGVVVRTHGLDGTLMLADTVGIPEALQPGMSVAIGFSRDFVQQFTVADYSSIASRTTIRLVEVTSADKAAPLIEQAVYAQPDDIGLDDEQRFRIGDIQGCEVVLEDGTMLGAVTDVWLLPANDVWVVTLANGNEVPFPVIDDVILSVDMDKRTVTVRPLPGLIELGTQSGEESDA